MNDELEYLKTRLKLALEEIESTGDDDELEQELESIEMEMGLLTDKLGGKADLPVIKEMHGEIKRLRIKYLNYLDDTEPEEFPAMVDIENLLVENTKSKINYQEFVSLFSEMADEILLDIIIGYAAGKSSIMISGEIFNHFLMNGYDVNAEKISFHVQSLKEKLGLEIWLYTLAYSMLNEKIDPDQVFINIQQLIEIIPLECGI